MSDYIYITIIEGTEISQHSRDSATTSEISTSPTEITVTAVTEAVGRTSDERSDASGKK
ncbi:6631_t:CDS:2 [Entrophospora sp. SA101]|nr:6631_t:CDS:2 [Entrophospora sp. SA101]